MSSYRKFDLQNDWVLLNHKSITNKDDTFTIALDVLKTYLNTSYVLPDSGVFILQEIENNLWKIWSGFRASKLDIFRVFCVGMASTNRTEIGDLNKFRTNFQGVQLKTTTVVSMGF